MAESDYAKILDILGKNADKNFVRRILFKNKYPTVDYGDGTYATHKMQWAERDGKYFVYPSIGYDEKNKSLHDFGKDAFSRALKEGDYIEFKNPNEADWFSKNYKMIWSADQ